MSASQRVQVLTNQANELAILGEFIKNPKLIEELTAEVKKLNALTSQEEQKVKEARDFISRHESLLADLEKEKLALAKDKENHEARVAGFSEQLAKVDSILADAKMKEENASAVNKKNEEERKQLEEYRAKLDRQNAQEREKLAADLVAVKRAATENEMEAGRLKRIEEKLKEKAEKIKGLISE